MESWEYVLYIGLAFFVIDAIIIMWRGLKDSQEFIAYIEEKYPAEFHRMVYQDVVKKLFRLTWHKDSLTYFMVSSTEDFGDPRIAIYRGKLRWRFYYFLINAVAAAVFFLIIALWFEYVVWR